MSLNRDEVNALGILGLRKLSFIPDHFSKISVDSKFDSKSIEQWIEHNLNSRYSMQQKYDLDSNRKMISTLEIGLEDPKELTILTLGCQHLHKKKEF